ncbi:hypothetical protein SDC9_125161 [bioreactor metagenome]|uniref:Uncharacterized protein n=1 Tax=bioreactor metagenome TaxID=1076179 RepID=A0A645CM69_9ZZZZ
MTIQQLKGCVLPAQAVKAQQKVLDRDVLVFHLLGFLISLIHDLIGVTADINLSGFAARAGNAGHIVNIAL